MKLVAKLEITNNEIKVKAHPEFSDRFLREDFIIKYETPQKSQLKIQKEYALIPFLANVAPIIWLSGLDVTIDSLDKSFAKALTEIREVYAEMYPSLRWTGTIRVLNLISSRKSTIEGVAMLFSGGVDSVFTALTVPKTNRGSSNLLVTALGSDIARSNLTGWNNVKQQSIKFSEEHGYENLFVDTNFRSFLDIPKIEKAWPEVKDGWWGGVQHGIGLLGLMAPIVQNKEVFIASTHTAGFTASWGSNPKLDSSMHWDSVSVLHHGYEYSRQEKLRKIINLSQGRKEKPFLRVCYSNTYGDGNNCGRCEKCLRTFVGLLISGEDPTEYGMEFSINHGIGRVKKAFYKKSILLGEDELFMWKDMQNHLSTTQNNDEFSSEVHIFMKWFKQFDLDDYYSSNLGLLKIRKMVVRTVRKNAWLESLARTLVAWKNRSNK